MVLNANIYCKCVVVKGIQFLHGVFLPSWIVCLFVCFLQEKVKAVFDNLIQLEHLNIVKFHKYWADVKENRARVGKKITIILSSAL